MILKRIRSKITGVPFSFGYTTSYREEFLRLASQYLASSQLSGGYAEFGVWRGDTFSTAYHYLSRIPKFKQTKYYAFDSFEGFPEPNGIDIHPIFTKSGRAFAEVQFTEKLRRRRVNIKQVITYPGWFSNTASFGSAADKSIDNGSLSLVWFDGDLYESTRDALPLIFQKLAVGGIIVFDDWNCFEANPQRGERLALSEYMNCHSDIRLIPFLPIGWHGTSFILHKRT